MARETRSRAFRFIPTGAQASAADLKFLHRLRQTHFRNFKSKSGTRIICLLVPLLLPKFVSEGAAMYHELRKRGTSPHFSHSMWPAPVQEADRAGAARRAMWDIGQARRRTLSASSTGPLGCLSAGISSAGRLNRMPRYAFRRPALYLPRRKSNAGRMECEKCGLVRRI